MSCLGEIGVVDENYDVLWEISDFFSLSTNTGDYYESHTFSFAGEKWCLLVYPGGNGKEASGFISLYLQKKLTKTECGITYTLDLKKADGSLFKNCRMGLNFKTDECGYPFFLMREELLGRRSVLVPFSVLTVVCTMRQNVPHSAPCLASNMKLSELEKLSKNFRGMLSHKKSCDVTLVVRGKSFRVHKSVMISRSSVFSAMFQHEMSESETSSVDIPDCDSESFGTFLEYLYSGKVEDISFGSALHLYRTAHKYDVQELKAFCLKFLDGNLTADGVIDAVILADEYDEDDLLSTAQDFFNRHFGEVIQTKTWESLNRQNFRLANKLNKGMSSYVSTLKKPNTNPCFKSLGKDANVNRKKLQPLNDPTKTGVEVASSIGTSSTLNFETVPMNVPTTSSTTCVTTTTTCVTTTSSSSFAVAPTTAALGFGFGSTTNTISNTSLGSLFSKTS